MLIKKSGSNFFKGLLLKKQFSVLVIILLFTLYTIGVFSFGVWTYRYDQNNGGALNTELKSVYRSLSNFQNYIQSRFNSSRNLKILSIDIKHKNFQRLAYDRELALSQTRLFDNDFVPAKITFKGQEYKIKIRLKGDDVDHLRSPFKWSFRLQVTEKDKSLLGMKRFSLQSPQTRNYLYEWVYHELLKSEDIISLRYDFVEVHLNGKNLGIYALEEHFDKILIESNHRREGPILKFNEDLFWKANAQSSSNKNVKRTNLAEVILGDENLRSESVSNIEPFKSNSTLNNSTLKKQFILGRDLLELFRRGDLQAHQVFDIDRLAKFIALSEITKTLHGVFVWGNLRFYYNPVTSLLEPIGFDGQTGNENINSLWASQRIQETPEYASYVGFYLELFKDMKFFEKYIQYIELYSSPLFIEEFFDIIEPAITEKMTIIHREYPQIDDLNEMKSVFLGVQNANRVLLSPSKGLHAYQEEYIDNNLYVSIGNTQIMPIEVLGIKSLSGQIYPSSEKLILDPKMNHSAILYKLYNFEIPQDQYSEELAIIYKVLGTSKIKSASVFSYPILTSNFSKNSFLRRVDNLSEYDFIFTDEKNKKIYIKPGIWLIDNDLIIPRGYVVYVSEDTHISLSNNSTILSYSPIYFEGTKENPILIHSIDESGSGLIVMEAEERSYLQYVHFKNLSSPEKGNWSLTGAVSFYESPVSISNVVFENSRSEDALNIIRSSFLIKDSLFLNSQFDAFDGDFVDGLISDTFFNNSGNDGIDVSGSSIKIDNVSMIGIKDKAISAGESSTVNISNTNITESEIAIASKDQSKITINNSKITDVKIALTAFQKKPEFGPSSITAKNLNFENIQTQYLLEYASSIDLDEKSLSPNAESVNKKLYGP